MRREHELNEQGLEAVGKKIDAWYQGTNERDGDLKRDMERERVLMKELRGLEKEVLR